MKLNPSAEAVCLLAVAAVAFAAAAGSDGVHPGPNGHLCIAYRPLVHFA